MRVNRDSVRYMSKMQQPRCHRKDNNEAYCGSNDHSMSSRVVLGAVWPVIQDHFHVIATIEFTALLAAFTRHCVAGELTTLLCCDDGRHSIVNFFFIQGLVCSIFYYICAFR